MATERKTCAHCGADSPTAANFCARCGQPFGPGWVRPAVAVTPLMQCWRRLKPRMTRKEVVTLLGEPARVEAAPPDSPEHERWRYEYERSGGEETGTASRRMGGTVSFSLSDGALVAWSEPEW